MVTSLHPVLIVTPNALCLRVKYTSPWGYISQELVRINNTSERKNMTKHKVNICHNIDETESYILINVESISPLLLFKQTEP